MKCDTGPKWVTGKVRTNLIEYKQKLFCQLYVLGKLFQENYFSNGDKTLSRFCNKIFVTKTPLVALAVNFASIFE